MTLYAHASGSHEHVLKCGVSQMIGGAPRLAVAALLHACMCTRVLAGAAGARRRTLRLEGPAAAAATGAHKGGHDWSQLSQLQLRNASASAEAAAGGLCELFVSTAGNDSTGDGSLGAPFATPHRALTAAQLQVGGRGRAYACRRTITLRSGVYELESPLEVAAGFTDGGDCSPVFIATVGVTTVLNNVMAWQWTYSSTY